MRITGKVISLMLCAALCAPGAGLAQEPGQAAAAPQKYKLTILEGASNFKRVKKGRVSSQAVVKVTDENDVPVAGIAVSFAIPQMVGGGASFANGALSTVITTNAMGVASSGAMTMGTAGSAFSISVTASVPGTALTASVPVNMAAAAAAAGGAAGGAGAAAGAAAGAGAGVSTGVIVGVVAAIGAAVAAGVAVAAGGGDKTTPAASPTVPRGSIGSVGAPVFGPPR